MKKLIFDACSLIYLTKIRVKERLPSLGEILVSKTVRNELLEDLDKFDDAKIIKKNIDDSIIKISKFKLNDVFKTKNLGKGEKETIEICLKDEGIPITDDHGALNLALSFGLKPKTSEIILLDLLRESMISYEEFKEFFEQLAVIKALNPEILTLFNEKAKKIMKNKIEDD